MSGFLDQESPTLSSGGSVSANQGTPNSDANAWPVVITDKTREAAVTAANALKTDSSATTQPVSAASLPLPTGASTEATLSGIKTDTDKLTFISTRLLTDGSGVTQPVSASFLPLPTGAATSANQTTANTSLTSIDSKLTNPLPVSGSVSVSNFPASQTINGTVTANIGTTNGLALDATLTNASQKTKIVDSAGTNLASISASGAVKVDGSAITQPISGTVTSNQGTANATPWNSNIAQYGGTATTLGQKVMASSAPVTIASDQSAITVTSNDGAKQSYSACANNIAVAAAATDIFLIGGSGTKTIRVRRIGLSATQTTAGEISFHILKRSTADTAGTAATLTPHDSNNAAATAVVQSFTVNPTVGTSVGNIRSSKLFAPATASASAPSTVDFPFGDAFSQAVVLRGTAQQLCINLIGATVVGGSFNFYVEWTEE